MIDGKESKSSLTSGFTSSGSAGNKERKRVSFERSPNVSRYVTVSMFSKLRGDSLTKSRGPLFTGTKITEQLGQSNNRYNYLLMIG